MDKNELRDILNGYFGWNKARMACFVGMLISLFKVRTGVCQQSCRLNFK